MNTPGLSDEEENQLNDKIDELQSLSDGKVSTFDEEIVLTKENYSPELWAKLGADQVIDEDEKLSF